MEEKNLKKLWLISIFVILVLFSMYLLYINKDNQSTDKVDSKKYDLVKNYSDFYTVNYCLTRYMVYLSNKETVSLLKVLDKDFIKNNNINETNIYNYLSFQDLNSFKPLKMYEEKINSNMKKYYVYGYTYKDEMDTIPEYNDAYFIVKLDKKNMTYAIQPYNGDIFK